MNKLVGHIEDENATPPVTEYFFTYADSGNIRDPDGASGISCSVRSSIIGFFVIAAATIGVMKYDQRGEQHSVNSELEKDASTHAKKLEALISAIIGESKYDLDAHPDKLNYIRNGVIFSFGPDVTLEAVFYKDKVECVQQDGERMNSILATPILYENNNRTEQLYLNIDGENFTLIVITNNHLTDFLHSRVIGMEGCEPGTHPNLMNGLAYVYSGELDSNNRISSINVDQAFPSFSGLDNSSIVLNIDKNPKASSPCFPTEAISALIAFYRVEYLPKVHEEINDSPELDQPQPTIIVPPETKPVSPEYTTIPFEGGWTMQSIPAQESQEILTDAQIILKAFDVKRDEWFIKRNLETGIGEWVNDKWIDEKILQKLADGFAKLAKEAGINPKYLADQLIKSQEETQFIRYPGDQDYGMAVTNQIIVQGDETGDILLHEWIHYLGVSIHWPSDETRATVYEEGITQLLSMIASPTRQSSPEYTKYMLLTAALGPAFYFNPIIDPVKNHQTISASKSDNGGIWIDNPLMDNYIEAFAKKLSIKKKDLPELHKIFAGIPDGKDELGTNPLDNIKRLRKILEKNNVNWKKFLLDITPPGLKLHEEWIKY